MEAFSAQLHAEALRRGLGRAKRVIVAGDGAAWIWNLAQDRFKEAVQRVDLYHVKQLLWAAVQALYSDPAQAKVWMRKMKNLLRRSQCVKVIHTLEEALHDMQETQAARRTVEKEIHYLKNNQNRMDYASAIARGEPVGSGAIESTCRQYQCRMKRPGQFWTPKGDEALLNLESAWRNQRWQWLFPHIAGFHPSKN